MQYINYQLANHVVTLTLNRPDRLNALGSQMYTDLGEALQRYERDDEARVAVITGAGTAFSAGADLKELQERGSIEHPDGRRDWYGFTRVTKPLIAAVNGQAFGAGFLVAMFCDIRIAAESASFCLAEVKRGRFAAVNLPARQGIPYCVLVELGLGEVITASRAAQYGLVNFAVPDDELLDEAHAMAQRIAALSPSLVKLTKAVLRDVVFPTEQASALSEFIELIRRQSPEVQEGIANFVSKTSPS